MQHTRQPAFAGSFYPEHAPSLAQEVQRLLQEARSHDELLGSAPKAIIVPHAGYIYSGATAALAYAQLYAVRKTIRRVVLLGPAHRVAVRGIALPDVAAFATPLGSVEVDQVAAVCIKAFEHVVLSSAAHAMEHSIEVQLPFLQTVLEDFRVLPLAVGNATPDEVAQVLDAVWNGAQTLIVVSTDLSHYLAYVDAKRTDQQTVQTILDLRGPISHTQACGGTAIGGLLLAARHHHLTARLLGMCNSGDTAGDKDRVVGYASFAFS